MLAKSMGWRSFASAAAILVVSAGSALAAPTAGDILSTFNLITTGDVSTGSDIVGNAVIGGDVTASTFFGGGNNVPASPELSVYGTVSSSFNFAKAGTLFYTGTVNQAGFPTVNFNGGSQVTTLPHPLSYYTAPLFALSTQLEGTSATVGATFSNGVFNAGANTGIVVFDITGSALAAGLVNHDISFTGAAGTTFIVNVDGDFTMPNSSHLNTLYSDALFNFYNAGIVNIGTWSGASILAPDAAVSITGGGNISGSLFAKSYLGGGELHNDNLFGGDLPPVTSAPEPSTWAMLIAGFAGIGFLGLRRARRQAAPAA